MNIKDRSTRFTGCIYKDHIICSRKSPGLYYSLYKICMEMYKEGNDTKILICAVYCKSIADNSISSKWSEYVVF